MSGLTSAATRFMESLHSLLRVRWDLDSRQGCRGAAVPAVCAGVSPAKDCGAGRPNGRRDARPTARRFMETAGGSIQLFLDAVELGAGPKKKCLAGHRRRRHVTVVQ